MRLIPLSNSANVWRMIATISWPASLRTNNETMNSPRHYGHGETEMATRDGQRTIDAALKADAIAALDAVNGALERLDSGNIRRMRLDAVKRSRRNGSSSFPKRLDASGANSGPSRIAELWTSRFHLDAAATDEHAGEVVDDKQRRALRACLFPGRVGASPRPPARAATRSSQRLRSNTRIAGRARQVGDAPLGRRRRPTPPSEAEWALILRRPKGEMAPSQLGSRSVTVTMDPNLLLPNRPLATLDEYLAAGGGRALAAARNTVASGCLAQLERAGLRGRVLPGFRPSPNGARSRRAVKSSAIVMQLRTARKVSRGRSRTAPLMRANPYQVLEGLSVAATVVHRGKLSSR